MTEIKFKLVDGEPVCLYDCPARKYVDKIGNACTVNNGKLVESLTSTCIPGLRQQRDEARTALAEARAVIEQVREAQIHESVSGEALYCCSRCTRKILRGERFMIVGKAAVCVECFFRALLPAPAIEGGYSNE